MRLECNRRLTQSNYFNMNPTQSINSIPMTAENGFLMNFYDNENS